MAGKNPSEISTKNIAETRSRVLPGAFGRIIADRP